MITRIILDNFMAHEHTELALDSGVNVLTGPNNTGKSAIVEALRCVATNPMPKPYIRHGAKEARVTVELEDGVRVVWVRKKRSAGYEIHRPDQEEPIEFYKFGRRPPEAVLELLKLDLVSLETGSEVDVHIGNQRSPIFLLDRPASEAAAFFAASTESAHLLAMQNRLKQRTQEAGRKERDLLTRLSAVEQTLDSYSPLPDISLRMETANELESRLKELDEQCVTLGRSMADMQTLQASLEQNERALSKLTATRQPPQLDPPQELGSLIGSMVGCKGQLQAATATKDALSPLQSPPVTEAVQPLSDLCEQTRYLQGLLSQANSVLNATSPLAQPPVCEETRPLSDCIDQLLTATYRVDRFSRQAAVFQSLDEPPVANATDDLFQFIEQAQRLLNEQTKGQHQLEQVNEALASLKQEIADRVDDIGCCPTCGADMNADDFITGRCRHEH